MELVLATQNPGKVREILLLLEGMPVTVKTLADFGIAEQDPELGETFEENSEAKARVAFEQTRRLALADDAGVTFPALGGPGVRTKEWIGGRDDPDRFAEFLRAEFEGTNDLSGTFRSVVTVIKPDLPGVTHQWSGEVNGWLTLEGRGAPVPHLPLCRHFIPDGTGKTLAEMGKDELERYSHRGIALRKASAFLRELSDGSG